MKVTVTFKHLKKSPSIDIEEIKKISLKCIHSNEKLGEDWALDIELENGLTRIVACDNKEQADEYHKGIRKLMLDSHVEISLCTSTQKVRENDDFWKFDLGITDLLKKQYYKE